MRHSRSAALGATLVLWICMAFAATANAIHHETANDEQGEVAAENNEAAARVKELLEQRKRERRERIERMWEDGDFETDSGGIIPFRVFWRGSRTLYGLAIPDVMRRGQFDEWCERIGLTRELDDEEREYLELAWDQYADEVNRAMLESYPPVFDVAGYLGEADKPMTRAVAAHAEELAHLSEEAMRRISAVERRLLTRIAALRDGAFAVEIDRWRDERQWERSLALHPSYPGARVHLTRLVRSMDEEWPPEVADLLRMYEMEIAQVAARFYSHRLQTMGRLNRLQAERFYDMKDQRYEPGSPVAREAAKAADQKAKADRRGKVRHAKRLYSINTQYLKILTQLDDTGTARLLEQAFHELAFPDIYPNDFDLIPVFRRVVSSDDFVPEDIREDVSDLAGQYKALARSIQENAKRFILRNRERDIVARTYHPDMLAERAERIESYINDQRETSVTFAFRLVELVEPVLEQEELDELRREIVELVGEIPLP